MRPSLGGAGPSVALVAPRFSARTLGGSGCAPGLDPIPHIEGRSTGRVSGRARSGSQVSRSSPARVRDRRFRGDAPGPLSSGKDDGQASRAIGPPLWLPRPELASQLRQGRVCLGEDLVNLLSLSPSAGFGAAGAGTCASLTTPEAASAVAAARRRRKRTCGFSGDFGRPPLGRVVGGKTWSLIVAQRRIIQGSFPLKTDVVNSSLAHGKPSISPGPRPESACPWRLRGLRRGTSLVP